MTESEIVKIANDVLDETDMGCCADQCGYNRKILWVFCLPSKFG